MTTEEDEEEDAMGLFDDEEDSAVAGILGLVGAGEWTWPTPPYGLVTNPTSGSSANGVDLVARLRQYIKAKQ